jgi:tetratricopeptide (TPR) repeat protein
MKASIFLSMLLLTATIPVAAEEGTPDVLASIESFANEAQRVRIQLADRILESLDGRDWVVCTEKDLAETLARRAASRGGKAPLHVLSVAFSGLPESERKAIQALGEPFVDAASFTPYAFARHWMESAPADACRHVALLEFPEMWRAAALEYVPNGLAYLGVADAGAAQEGLDERSKAAETLWDDVGEFLLDSEAEPSTPEASDGRAALRIGVSRAANELGALLERAGNLRGAANAYVRAYRLDNRNLSALMNRASAIRRGELPGMQEETVAELNRQNAAAQSDALRWNLRNLYGPVLHPEDFVGLGWHWALSGVPVGDTEAFEKGIASVPEEVRPGLRRMLSRGQAMQTAGTDLTVRAFTLLRDPKTRGSAAIALYRAASTSETDPAVCDHWLKVAEEAGAPVSDLATAVVSVQVERRDNDAAKRTLREALQKAPAAFALWRNLVILQSSTHDREGLAESIQALGRQPDVRPMLLPLARGLLLQLDERYAEARDELRAALEDSPGDPGVLDPLLRLDMQFVDRAAAKDHAEALLKAIPTHPFAHFILGSLAFSEGRYEDAVGHLRTSVERDPSAYVLNDYACALSAIGRYEEAVRAISAALQQTPDNPAMLDTLAEALIGLGKWDEAEEAVRKALSLGGAQTAVFRLREATILLHKGDREGARAALRKAEAGQSSFGSAETKLLSELRAQLDAPLHVSPPRSDP